MALLETKELTLRTLLIVRVLHRRQPQVALRLPLPGAVASSMTQVLLREAKGLEGMHLPH